MTQLLQNAVYGTAMILAVMVLRRVLKDRLAPGARLALWAACLFRLLAPDPPESVLSLWGLVGWFKPAEIGPQPAPTPIMPEPAYVLEPGMPIAPAASMADPAAAHAAFPWGTVLAAVWVLVGAAVGLWYAAGWLRARRAVDSAIPVGRGDPRYGFLPKSARLREGPMDGAPLTFGVARPTVVLSPGLEGEKLACVLVHEGVHASRRDNLWHYAAAIALAVHWWNPAVWVMARLLRQDVELSCDRAALKKLGEGRRADYARALVSLSTQAEGPAFCQTFGRKATEERILSIMKFKKMTVLGVVLTLVLVLGVTIAFASDPKTQPGEDSGLSGYSSEFTYGVTSDPESGAVLKEEPFGIIGERFYDYQFVEGGDGVDGGLVGTVGADGGKVPTDYAAEGLHDEGHFTTGYDEHGSLAVTGVRMSGGTVPLCDDGECGIDQAHYHNEDGAAYLVEYFIPGLLCTRTDCREEGQHQHSGVVYSARAATLTPEMYAAALDFWVELDAVSRSEANGWLEIFQTCYDRVQKGESDAFAYNIYDGIQLVPAWYVSDRVAAGYPVNSKGETYGPDLPQVYGCSPDLILAVGSKGEEGYVRESELGHGGYPGTVNNPEEAMAYMAWLETQPATIYVPLYDSEGNVIGQFGTGNPTAEGGSAAAPEPVPTAASTGLPQYVESGSTSSHHSESHHSESHHSSGHH